MTGQIEINRDIMQGKPVIRGTRIPVELLLRKLSEGATIEDLLAAYPRLSADGVRAALVYAADIVAHDTFWNSVRDKSECASSRMNAATSPPFELFGQTATMFWR